MRTLLAAVLALSVVVVAGCGSSCGDDVCYTPPPPRAVSTGYCGPVEPLAPLPTTPYTTPVVQTSYTPPSPAPLPARAPVAPLTAPNFCPPSQPCV